MRKLPRLLVFIIIATFCILPLTVYAHPGKTDSNGGHTDHSTGEYHYHHGYPAHDHYDMDGDGIIDCPYDFDDQTGVSSGNKAGNNNSGSGNSYGTKYAERDVYHSQTQTTPQSNNIHLESKENFRLSIGNMFDSLFFIGLTILIGGPIIFVLYCLALFIVRIPCSWLWKLINRSLSDEDNYKWSMVTANIVLLIILYTLFLSPVVELLICAPDTLATVIILIGILIFIGVCIVIRTFSRNDSMNQIIRTLEKEHADLSLQLKNATSKSIELEKQSSSFEAEIDRLKMENAEMFATINNLRSNDLKISADTDNNDFVSLLESEGIYFINGSTPIKGRITARKSFGDYTAYVSSRGRCYHSDPYCGGHLLTAVHIFKVYDKRLQCSKCLDVLPNGLPEWYTANRDRFSLN